MLTSELRNILLENCTVEIDNPIPIERPESEACPQLPSLEICKSTTLRRRRKVSKPIRVSTVPISPVCNRWAAENVVNSPRVNVAPMKHSPNIHPMYDLGKERISPTLRSPRRLASSDFGRSSHASPKIPLRKAALVDMSPRKPRRCVLSRENSLEDDDDETSKQLNRTSETAKLLREALITAVDFCDLTQQ